MSKDIDDGLTDEERLALADDEGADTQAAADNTTVDTLEEDDKAGEQAAAEPADKAKTAAEASATESATQAATTEATTEAQPQAPILVAPPPEDAAAKLAEIDTKKDALLTQFDDGDITAKEYQKQLDALAKEERAIERAQDRAELAAQMEQQRLQNEWTATCNTFVEQHAIYKDNPRLYKALDNEVRELAAKPETANWTGQKFLDEAHKALKAAFKFADDAPAPKTNKPPVDRNLPPNLAKVPAADVEDTNGGKFAVLDRMAATDPIRYEETLAKMSEAERDAYLASA